MLEETQALLRDGKVEDAKARLEAAVRRKAASNHERAVELQHQIRLAEDPDVMREALVGLSDEQFAALEQGDLPRELESEYEVLADRIRRLAGDQLAAAKAERQERLAAEIARRERAEKAREHESRSLQAKKEAYISILETTGVRVVQSVSVTKISSHWQATLTVRDSWHRRHRQNRLQDAQVLWKTWALLASPDDLDRARIKILDRMGNEVGGSRLLAGSMIWVQD